MPCSRISSIDFVVCHNLFTHRHLPLSLVPFRSDPLDQPPLVTVTVWRSDHPRVACPCNSGDCRTPRHAASGERAGLSCPLTRNRITSNCGRPTALPMAETSSLSCNLRTHRRTTTRAFDRTPITARTLQPPSTSRGTAPVAFRACIQPQWPLALDGIAGHLEYQRPHSH